VVLAWLLAAASAAASAQTADPEVLHGDGFESAICGDGQIDEAEQCDDSNRLSRDGCSALCRIETSFTCAGAPSSCSYDCSAGPLNGFIRSGPTTWTQLTGAPDFPAMNPMFSAVPHLADKVYLGAGRLTFTSVMFTVPAGFAGAAMFDWSASQIPGTYGQAAPSLDGPLAISRCPGDFRVGIANPAEPTDFQGCKSIRVDSNGAAAVAVLALKTSGFPSDSECLLTPGGTYFLNYTNVNPTDGVPVSEWTCPGNVTHCGVQFHSQ
jgi:cysteine-rich repeat protein